MRNVKYLESCGVDVKKSLELFGDIDIYNKSLGEFINSAPDKIQKIEEYKNQKDMINYSLYVHSLMSDARYFGFNSLADYAEVHEKSASVGDVLFIKDEFPKLKTQVIDAVKVATNYLNGNKDNDVSSSSSTNVIALEDGEIYNNDTILVVDDSNIIRNFVKRIFASDYSIGTAKNGQEAINIINSNKDNKNIKAILLDLNMPGVDGFEVLEYMKKNNVLGSVPVSIISGDSTKDTINKAFTYDIVDMLSKPFNENDIKRIINKTILYSEMQ